MELSQAENSLLLLEKQIKELRNQKQEREKQERYIKYNFLPKSTVDGLKYDVGFNNVDEYLNDKNGYLFITMSDDGEYNCFFYLSEDRCLQSIQDIISEGYPPAETQLYHNDKRYDYTMKLTLVPIS